MYDPAALSQLANRFFYYAVMWAQTKAGADTAVFDYYPTK